MNDDIELYMLKGKYIEKWNDDAFVMNVEYVDDDTFFGEVIVATSYVRNTSNNSSKIPEFKRNQKLTIVYNGIMTRTIPGRITALEIYWHE